MVNEEKYKEVISELKQSNTTLVAVSKLKPAEDIQKLYDLGQRDFGENYVQELMDKQVLLSEDIRWHAIGHLQTNKVKYIAPFVYLIQSVDSEKLLKEIDKQGAKNNRIINCLLQVHIADEETKFGFDENELSALNFEAYPNVNICGLMGMATFTDNKQKVKSEFEKLHNLYKVLNLQHSTFNFLSMGMSDDYKLAIECGSNMVRVGSLLFGRRD
jgi:pyridoxal phosphate enzyme (YggS family)